jgi:hypothetical protein
MYIFSETFLVLFLIGLIIVTIRARSQRKASNLPQGKLIAITGQQLVTDLSKQTPLVCLLVDGRKYGDGYQEKTAPELPHANGCQCRLDDVVQSSRELFSGQPAENERRMTDLGELSGGKARYYRYRLIVHHPDATESQRNDFDELAGMVSVPTEFVVEVERHLNGTPQNS